MAQYRVPLFRGLARREGIQLRVLYAATPERPNVEPSGFTGIYSPMWRRRIGGHPLYWHPAQWAAADRAQTDVLVLNWDVHYASLVPSMIRAKMNGVPTILWGHGYSKHVSMWRAGPRRGIAKMATALLFYNNTGRTMFRSLGWDDSRLFVALNSLDQAPIQAARSEWLRSPDRLSRFRAEQGLGDDPMLLFVSRLDAARRIDLLFRAVHALRRRYPALRLAVIGTGPAEQELRSLAASMGIAQHVLFVGPCYDESKLAPWFLSAKMFVFPSYMGLSLLHAFGYGLPVISGDRLADHGPEIEALIPRENGLLFAAADPSSLAECIAELLGDEDERRRMGDRARATVLERFNLDIMVDGFEAAVRHVARTVPT